MSTPFVYVGTWTIKPGKLEKARKYFAEHVDLVETNEPRMIAFHFFLDEAGNKGSVVQVHPDAASMEFHMQLIAEHLSGAFDVIDAIVSEQYFGPMTDALAETLAQWESPEVVTTKLPVHEAGFTRSTIR
jgi:quinol monooxygenase YgiN